MQNYLDFEKGLAELHGKAEELRAMARQDPNMDVSTEADQLDARASEMLKTLYAELTPWQKCQVARHPDRPVRDVRVRFARHIDRGWGRLGETRYRQPRRRVGAGLISGYDHKGLATYD